MEGNQARTVANIVRKHERSGALWLVLLICVLGGWLMGPTDRHPPTVGDTVEDCRPLMRTDADDAPGARSWDLLIEAGWEVGSTGDRLYPPACEGLYP